MLPIIPRWRQTPIAAEIDGCHVCRPALNYYLLSANPGEYQDDSRSRFINERVHANIQKDGTYSVVPRMFGGETNASELRRIADVVDLVENAEARDVLRADLGQDFVGGFELSFEAGIARVDDVQQQRCLQRLFER